MPKRKPKQKRAKKKPKTEKKPPKQAENHPNSLQTILKGGSITQLKELLELALAAAGDMIRHLRVEYLRLHYTFAGQPDPAKAALRWGKANIGGDVIGHLLEQHLNILRREVTAEVDFCSEQSAVYAAGSCSIRVGAALLVTLRLLRSYLQWKKRQGKTPAQEEKTYG